MSISKPQAQALANLIHEIRPDWPTASLMTLLAKNREHSFPELCKAGINVATDTTKKTPAIIFMDGPHWRTTTTQAAPPQQFLTAAEKSRLVGAQRAGYLAVKEGFDPFDTSHPFHQPLISPSDLNPAATLDAYRRGRAIAEWEQQQQNTHPAITADFIDEGETI